MLIAWRQLRYPREFRIGPPVWPGALTPCLKRLLLRKDRGELVDPQPRAAVLDKQMTTLLADVATSLWRLRGKMIQADTGRPFEEMRRAYRHLESAWDALVQAGLDIQDHTDQPYDSGLSLSVIAIQPLPELTREMVIETISPSIYLKGRRIQTGQVIVGRPSPVDADAEVSSGGVAHESSHSSGEPEDG